MAGSGPRVPAGAPFIERRTQVVIVELLRMRR